MRCPNYRWWLHAHDAGTNVLIISKNKKGDPHTVLARGGINAALGTIDPEYPVS
jgi:succinate dehydrogenase flavoprotein subunit